MLLLHSFTERQMSAQRVVTNVGAKEKDMQEDVKDLRKSGRPQSQ